ncbi:MAG: FliM/FliN family flagellar motor switch protein [Polyangiaceae bacterium]
MTDTTATDRATDVDGFEPAARRSVLPFPWQGLPKVVVEDLGPRRAFGAWLGRTFDLELATSTARELVGEDVGYHADGSEGRPPSDVPCVSVDLRSTTSSDLPFRVDVPAGLAVAIVARVLRRNAPRLFDPSFRPTPELSGAFAACVGAVVARATRAGAHVHLSRPVQVEDTNPGPSAWTSFAVTIRVGGEAFAAWIAAPRDRLALLPRTDEVPRGDVGTFPVTLSVVGAVSVGDGAAVASLAPGDVWLPGPVPFRHVAKGRLEGTFVLVPPSGDRGIVAVADADGRLRLTGDGRVVSWHADDVVDLPSKGPVVAMTESTADSTHVDADTATLGYERLPVVVRVELADVTMSAAEWSRLRPGDVVPLGVPLGQRVVLRAGGTVVATGDLVDVDGELGVRILAREEKR